MYSDYPVTAKLDFRGVLIPEGQYREYNSSLFQHYILHKFIFPDSVQAGLLFTINEIIFN